MYEFELLVDLHKDGYRQGPGSDTETNLAIGLSGLTKLNNLKIADIGCGTGASTLLLAQKLDAQITAVDLFPEFLNILQKRAYNIGVADKIQTLSCSMDKLPFEDNSYDAVWSEGAIYNMGFEKGIAYLKRFIKPSGILAVSELTWLTSGRPGEITSHWKREYPEVSTTSAKIKILEDNGFVTVGYFPLPVNCWIENYYNPLQRRFEVFLEQHQHNDQAHAIIDAEEKEIALYKRYQDYYSYGFYIARRL